ncbi:MAG: hypothetical protein LBL79_00940 [Prevotella sp.]|jgi:hypothetical protein|nr:hypothetical protein [Prevotella sp.]
MKKKLLLLFLAVFSLGFVYGQKCETSFTSHKTGSQVSGWPVTMSGKAVNVPATGHVWILVESESFRGWYPQGNGECVLTNSEWVCDVHLGNGKQTGFYKISIAVVGDKANQALNNWVKKAEDTGAYPTIPFPDVLDGCSITTIRVEKR